MEMEMETDRGGGRVFEAVKEMTKQIEKKF